ncbi:hypothetical protein ACIPPS_24645 [Streptomyces sp. NPDC090127]|uniref:hypothetical protein n=1 Tax=Streptomyces sp. NPDC090127 TaxID=3365953 RepID=UPI0037FC4A33
MSDMTDAAAGAGREAEPQAGRDAEAVREGRGTGAEAVPERGTGAEAVREGSAGAEAVPEPGAEVGFEAVAPAPLGVERAPTGRLGVDALLERLADADRLSADGHLEVYEDVHRGLRDELTSLDAVHPGPTPVPGAGPTPPYDLRS